MGVDVGSAVGHLDLDISGFSNNLRTAQTEASRTTSSMASTISTNMNKVGKTLTSVGSKLTKTVTVPIAGIATAAVTTTAGFDKSMSKVSAISGATGKDLDKLRDKAKEMGAKTKFSATESADAFTYMAMAGWDTTSMVEGIDGIMSLAAADGLDLATTSDIVTDSLTAFGLSAKDSSHFADVMAKAGSSANTNVSLLGESFKYCAPVCGSLGYSAEDTAIALGLMANAGIKGSQGGTTLRAALTKLVKPTDDAAQIMKDYGLSMTKSDGSMKSLGEVMVMLRTKLGGLSKAQQAQVAATLFGQESMSGMLAIINASDSDFDNLTASIYDADGAAQSMSETMLDNLSGQLTLLKSALEGLAISIGEILMPYVRQFVEWLQKVVDKLNAMSPAEKEQVVKLGLLAAAIGPVLLAFGKIITTVQKVSKVFKAVKLAIAGVSAPVVAIVAVIAVLVAAFTTLWKTNSTFKKNVTAIWKDVKKAFDDFGKGIVKRLNDVGFNFEDITDVIKAVWKGFCEFLAPIFETAFKLISNVLKTVLGVITGLLDVFIGLFTGDWKKCWTGIKEIFGSLWDGIKGILSSVLDGMKGILNTVLGWFGTSWDKCWNSIKNFFEGIWNGIKDFFSGILNGIKEFFEGIWNGIKGFITDTLGAIKDKFSEIWNSIKDNLSKVWETMKNIVQVAIMAVVEIVKAAFQLITLPFRLIWENCKDTIVDIWNAIKEKISNFLSAIKEKITTVWNAIKEKITSVMTAIKEKVSEIWNTIKEKVSTVVTAIKDKVAEIWNALKEKVTNIVTAIKDKVVSIFNTVKEKVSTIWGNIKEKITNVVSAIKEKVSTVFTAVKEKVAEIFNAVKEKVSTIWGNIKEKITNVVNAIKDKVTSVFNAVKEKVSSIFGAVKDKVSSIWGSIKDKIASVVGAIKDKITSVFNAVKEKVASIFGGVKDKITGPMESAKEKVSSVVGSIKDKMSSGFGAAKDKVASIFGGIKDKIGGLMEGARDKVGSVIEGIKSKFNFSWSLPTLKLPHPKISGEFSLNPPKVPSFSIDWYSKAMDNAMILNGATIFGSKGGKLLGGGEAGAEVVSGADTLMAMIKKAVQEVIGSLANNIATMLQTYNTPNTALVAQLSSIVEVGKQLVNSVDNLGYVSYNGFVKVSNAVESKQASEQNVPRGGDTFIFNSPKAIDEIEAARQLKRTKRELSEGF